MAVLIVKITVLKAAIRAGVMDGANDRVKQSSDSTMAVKVATPMNSSVRIRCQFIYLEGGGEDLLDTTLTLPKQRGLLLLRRAALVEPFL